MKRLILTSLAVALFALSLGGCVQMHSDTVINEDGSGTATIDFSVSPVVAEAAQEMRELNSGDDDMEIPSIDDMDKGEIEKAAKEHGVKVKKFEKKEIEGRKTLSMEFEFKDLKGLSFVMGTTVGEDPSQGMGIVEDSDGNFILQTVTYDFPVTEEDPEEEEAETAPEEMDPEMMQKQMAIMGKMMGAMAELDVKMTITVPGDIISSNAPLVEGRTSTWTINSGNMMTAGQDMEPNIKFSSKGLKIKPTQQ